MVVTNDSTVDDYCGSSQREWFDGRPYRCRSEHRWQRERWCRAMRHMHWCCAALLSVPPSVLLRIYIDAEVERGWRWALHYCTSSFSSSTICIGTRGGRGESWGICVTITLLYSIFLLHINASPPFTSSSNIVLFYLFFLLPPYYWWCKYLTYLLFLLQHRDRYTMTLEKEEEAKQCSINANVSPPSSSSFSANANVKQHRKRTRR